MQRSPSPYVQHTAAHFVHGRLPECRLAVIQVAFPASRMSRRRRGNAWEHARLVRGHNDCDGRDESAAVTEDWRRP